ncbi:class I adenylate-forming enzyme family protein [Williamsia sp.]|uniref:class I adenylate-forming enzyme family protein n=1 Tax=Williamsia sp. TaxID=1872085 RepID=UPI002F94FB46
MPESAPTAQTIEEMLKSGATRFPDKPAVIDPDTRITYRELDASTRDMATGFIEAGVGKGSRVGVIMPNSARWVQIAVSLTRIGAVLVPLSTLLSPRELLAQCEVAALEFLVCVREFRGHRYLDDLQDSLHVRDLTDQVLYHPELPTLRRIWTDDGLPPGADSASMGLIVDALADTVHPDDPLVITFTSGSSGIPKGVMHSHAGALGAVASGLADRCITPNTRLYVPMPFFWVGGFGSGVLSALVAGATLVTEQIPRPEDTLRLLERERVTLFRGWPDQAAALARHQDSVGADLSSLVVGSLDALLPADQRAAPGARARLFGMTETFGPYCGFPADTDMPPSAWGSCGKPFSGMEVRIVSRDGVAPIGTAGEIQVRGPHVMQGICRRARGDIFTADGFYPTGDLGRFDADGFLFYHGRSDDMFKVSGASVYPSEVEKALRGIAGVQGAYVTDVPVGGVKQVGAAVVCDTAAITIESLRVAAATLLSSFKVPTVWYLANSDDDIPRGGTGKVPAPQLRRLLSAANADTPPHHPEKLKESTC